MWTFTLDPSRIPGVTWRGEPLSVPEITLAVAYLRRTWNKFLTAWRRDDPALDFIAVLELQGNGCPHLHVLVSGWYPWRMIQARWRRYGGGAQVHVTAISRNRRNGEGVALYLAKYLSKSLPAPEGGGDVLGDSVSDALPFDRWPARTRHHTSSRRLHLAYTATQWASIVTTPWRECFPRVVGMSPEDAEAICRGCVYRRPREGCSGVCEPVELHDGLGPIGPRRKSLSRTFWWDSTPHLVTIPYHGRYSLTTLVREVHGRFVQGWEREWT